MLYKLQSFISPESEVDENNVIDSVSGDYKRKTEAGCSASVVECGGFDNYRNLSHYLREFSDFIHWYEQMFDRKPWERECL